MRQCGPETNRSGRCFTCGERGHLARECKSPPKCPLCADLGRDANHRLGSKACNPPAPTRGGSSGSSNNNKRNTNNQGAQGLDAPTQTYLQENLSAVAEVSETVRRPAEECGPEETMDVQI